MANVLVAGEVGRPGATRFQVERARGYRDRLVLKLQGVDNAGSADELRGRWVSAPADEVPRLPKGVHYAARLVGLRVLDEQGNELGRVFDVTGAGGADLLVVEGTDGEEILVPLAGDIVRDIRESDGVVRVRLPVGLLGLNPGEGKRS